jgi:hypothetical protein
MPTCRFCGLDHKPCDKVYCYCGTDPAAARGEGYNANCSAYWGDGV